MRRHFVGISLGRIRCAVASFVLAASLGAASDAGAATASGLAVTVFKSPYCGCCANWVAYLRDQGFDVEVHDKEELDTIKNMAGVPDELRSCHTATIDGFVIEGHVPVEQIQRLLSERPEVRGLAVPGMPVGSPGMEGHGSEGYSVYGFGGDEDGEIFAFVPAR